MAEPLRTSGRIRSVFGRARVAVKNRAINALPGHYRTPTADYAIPKILKSLTTVTFMGLDRVGLHFLPKHFYTPIPDYKWLRANRRYWDGRAPMTGVHWQLDEQLAWLREICSPFVHEVAELTQIDELSRRGFGPGYGPIDAQVLHCFVRSRAPGRVVEIGSGVSTAVMVSASRANEREGRQGSQITIIDPYPTNALRQNLAVKVVRDQAQCVPRDLFDELQDGDLLFIDSSHAVKVGSDVVRLFLEVIPQLPPGVTIHVHDVSLPYLYPRTVLSDYFGWQETTLLLALLTGNPCLWPLVSMSALHYDRRGALQEILPDYRPQEDDTGMRAGGWAGTHFPDSMWIQVAAEPGQGTASFGNSR
jgi:predicted O-methyltransferase YrrM